MNKSQSIFSYFFWESTLQRFLTNILFIRPVYEHFCVISGKKFSNNNAKFFKNTVVFETYNAMLKYNG